jgi:nitrate/nitrite-specific signal transduction histidine kinase
MADEKKSADAQDFIQVFRRGVQFTEELLAENERLRFRMADLEREVADLQAKVSHGVTYKDLIDKMHLLEEERERLLQRFESMEQDNVDWSERYEEMEAEYDRLANLYVASYQLHTTLDPQEVIRIAFEILVNLIGAERFALYLMGKTSLLPIKAEGMDLASFPEVVPGQGRAGEAARDRSPMAVEGPLGQGDGDGPLACVPLYASDELIGMFVIEHFLPQKTRITDVDRELFKLLATHAGTALYASGLNARLAQNGAKVADVLAALGG